MAVVSPANQSAIANLYIALFNRAPDAAGFAFWTQALANGASLASITQGFVATPEARAIYTASQSSTDFVAAYYTTVLGRTPDAEGLAFWTKALDAKGGAGSDAARAFVVSQIVETVSTPLPVKPADLTEAEFVLTYGDRYKFINKGVVAVYYADTYKGNDLALAKTVLTVVNPTVGSIDTAIALLTPSTPATPPVVVPPVVVAPQHFVGTDGVDNFVGGAGDDTFEFIIDNNTLANTTLTLKDVITGGAGNDTLTVTTTGTVTNSAFTPLGSTISGIETLVLTRTGASSVTLDAPVGVTTIVADGGSGNLNANELVEGTKVVLKATTGGNVNPFYQAAATNAALELTGGVSATSVQFSAAGLTSLTVTSNGSANTLTSLVTSPQITTVNIVADTALSVGYLQASSNGANVTVSGAGAVNLATLVDPSIKVVNATANTGGLTATLSSNNPVIAITGSSGNDTISTGIALTTGSVNAGAGSADRLIVTSTSAMNSAALAAKYTGFEILQVGNGVNVDLTTANIAGITSVEIADGAGSTNVAVATAEQASAITILSANPTGIIGIAAAAGIDTVKATVVTTLAGGAQAINLSGIGITNTVTKLELTGNGASGDASGLLTLTTTTAPTLTSIVVKNEGGATITIGSGHTGANLSIDASGSAGAVTITTASYNVAGGVTIKGGSGTNVLTGSTRGDTIVGGAGTDTINAGATVVAAGVFDTLTGNGGINTFVFSVSGNDTAHGGITAVITDFKTGIDKIQLGVSAPASAAGVTIASSTAANLATLLTAADTALAGSVRVYVGQFGDDSYVVADSNGTGYTDVIKLTGVALAGVAATDFVVLTPP
jgi:hypothetical protein